LTAGKYYGAAQGSEEVVECCRGDCFVPPACQAGFIVANANPQMQDASMKPIPATVGAGLSGQANADACFDRPGSAVGLGRI
jgi:hypothetical protein